MTALTFNPLTEFVLTRRDGDVIAVAAAAPRRGKPLRIVTFARDKDPEIFALLHRIASGGGQIEADLDDAAWDRLADAGLLVPEDQVPIRPRFRCDPRDPPRDLLPLRARITPRDPARLVVSPSLRFDGAIGAPDHTLAPSPTFGTAVARPAMNPFAADCAWAWADAPDAAAPIALSIAASDRDAVRALRPGEAPPDLDPELALALRAADVIIDPDDAAQRRAAWAAARAEASAKLRRDRYAVLPGLIAPAQIAALRRYYRQLVAEGHVRFDDRQVPLRFSTHNEPLARFFLRALTGVVGELAGEPVKPSYVFFGSYRPGAVLEPHKDRDQCAISISLQIDYEPDPEGTSPWPLFLGLDDDAPRGRSAAVHLGLGDGLFYRGTELVHWRDALPEGHTSTSLFLHYVPRDFEGSLD